MKKYIAFVLVLILLLGPAYTVSAADASSQKEEAVYGILDTDGSVNDLYVVNIFEGGSITDFGEYSDIRSLTSSEKISRDGDRITAKTGSEKFYYQGTLVKKDLPWNILIKYYLNGSEISGRELAGKSGSLKISLSVKQNHKTDSTFFNNYALQISLSLNSRLCSGIKAKNATIAEAGGSKQLTYTVLPGDEADITITADVKDFRMDAVSINGIKLSLGIQVDSDDLKEQLSQLTDAIKELDGGAEELLDGLEQLADGMQKFTDGLKAFSDGTGQLSAGAGRLNAGAVSLKYGLSELAKQNDLLMGGALSIQKTAFDTVNAQLGALGSGLPVLTPENYTDILSQMPTLSEVKQQLDGAVQFTQGLKGYTDGVVQLTAGAANLAAGTEGFSSSSSAVPESANELYNAGAELNTAIAALRGGFTEYRNGTEKLKDETSGMDSEVDKKISEMLGRISGTGDKTISFVSDKNTNVSAVQFVLRTEPMKLPEAHKEAVPEPAELNFWQKLLKLFGLYRG